MKQTVSKGTVSCPTNESDMRMVEILTLISVVTKNLAKEILLLTVGDEEKEDCYGNR